MLDYNDQISDYLKNHFEQRDPDIANFRKSTRELLGFLFSVFPQNCISDYELHDIMLELGYEVKQWVDESFIPEEDGSIRVAKRLTTGWCLHSEFDLRDDEYRDPEE